MNLDAAVPVEHLQVSKEMTRLCCTVSYSGLNLGTLELPIFEGFISNYVLSDAIAAEYAWEILGEYFRRTLYPQFAVALDDATCAWSRNGFLLRSQAHRCEDPAFHNAVGWTVFLQELWDRPSSPDSEFYAPAEGLKPDEAGPCDTRLQVEVSETLPEVPVRPGAVAMAVTLGGASLGLCRAHTSAEGDAADAIVSAITYWGGFELCRTAVRDGLVGRPVEGSGLRARLAEYARNLRSLPDPISAPYDQQLAPVGRQVLSKSLPMTSAAFIGRYPGPIGTSVSRRAHLPPGLLPNIVAECNVNGPPIVVVGKETHPRSLLYAPDLIAKESLEQRRVPAPPRHVDAQFGRGYWEGLFARSPDPWRYSNRYEQEKYEQTLSLVPDGIAIGLELASAEGFFTEKLAARVGRLISSDVSQIAVSRAAERCAQFRNIEFRRIDFVGDELPDGLDLIVCSEVLYYIGGLDVLQAVASKIEQALNPGGYFLTAHANQVIDDPRSPGFDWAVPFGALKIGEVFASTNPLKLVKEVRTPLYRIQLYQKAEREVGEPERIEKSLSFPLPPHIEQMVLWNGSERLAPTNPTHSETRRLPILTYHRVAPAGSASLARFRVSPEDFEAQIRYLKEAGYYTTTFEDWHEASEYKKPLPGRAVIITFDDGYADFAEFAWPILKSFGMTATVFVVANQVGGSNVWDRSEEVVPLMTAAELRRLQDEGATFGSHSLSHRSLVSLPPAEVAAEHFRSRCKLANILGQRVKAVSYPYGAHDAVVSHLAGACGYLYGVTTRQSACRFTDSMLALPRIEINGCDNLERFIAKLTHVD
jgi:peptidoglycan/xylan/chitin deacetylase (PgdA/CDA1 family)/SAM-dependent methyltransferase